MLFNTLSKLSNLLNSIYYHLYTKLKNRFNHNWNNNYQGMLNFQKPKFEKLVMILQELKSIDISLMLY